MNRALCNSCQKLVPADRAEDDGRVFLVKHCRDCGDNRTLISNNAARSNKKRGIDADYSYHGCTLQCPTCQAHASMRFAFVNVTNRCNLNCPICFDNVPGLGFEFEPPMEYFDRIFQRLAECDPPPSVCLFGGEPTAREDLFDIIALCRSYNLRPRVFTNGLRLADVDYCRKLCQTHAELLISYDGANPAIYSQLRGTAKVGELKRRAIDNVGKLEKDRHRKMTLVSVLAKDLNADVLPELLDFCHERREFIGTVYLMPLVHAWNPSEWDYDPERMTTEDVEDLVAAAFPGYDVEFLPLGFIHQFGTLVKSIGHEALPYGAHPNCESAYFLVSDGKKWVPVGHYLRGGALDLGDTFMQLERRLAAREKRWQTSRLGRSLGALGLRRAALRFGGLKATMFFVMRHVRFWRLIKGRGPAKFWHALALPFALTFGRSSRNAFRRHTNVQGQLRVIILPLEDNQVLETERLERCPTLQAYYDPEADEVRFVPLCAWKLHNRTILKKISDYYAAVGTA